jgi:hypothetical protein
MNTKKLINSIINEGYKPQFIKAENVLTDNSIVINEDVAIQLSSNGSASVSKKLSNGSFMFYDATRNIETVLQDIQSAVLSDDNGNIAFTVLLPVKGKPATRKPDIVSQDKKTAVSNAIKLYGESVLVIEPYKP